MATRHKSRGTIFFTVLEEMKAACPNLNRSIAVAGYVAAWVKTRNPFNIDAAVYLCSLEGIEPPPTLAKEVAAVAKLRLHGETSPGTASQIIKENAKFSALMMMAKLCAAGATQEAAASKVAQFLSQFPDGPKFKASTLEKYYSEKPKDRHGRNWREMERDMRELFQDDPDHLAEWQAALEVMPEASDEVKGNRRD